MKLVRYAFHVGRDALNHFLADDGWAIASHIALSALMALFPFLIVITSLAGFFGTQELADQVVDIMIETWPDQVADALTGEIHNVLTTTRGDALTIGLALSIYFASNGIESLRVALNRAYGVTETRSWYWLRLESIGYTLVAAFVALALALLIVLGPFLLATAEFYLPVIAPKVHILNVMRYGIAILSLVAALFVLHTWLPAGRRTLAQIFPGIIFTMVASLISAALFGQYLARFAGNYVTTYAGLASVIIALVFLYFIAAIFVYGGALNAAIIRSRLPDGVTQQEAQMRARGDLPA
ncbi:MAG: YihY/virulence factor BrkB family protein [Bradyrhizobiaceae bacterium]|nr:MAG: YihY/virulence factor BrkB family protein [Bradyrhizobiaceae bacterium]